MCPRRHGEGYRRRAGRYKKSQLLFQAAHVNAGDVDQSNSVDEINTSIAVRIIEVRTKSLSSTQSLQATSSGCNAMAVALALEKVALKRPLSVFALPSAVLDALKPLSVILV